MDSNEKERKYQFFKYVNNKLINDNKSHTTMNEKRKKEIKWRKNYLNKKEF